MFRSHSQVRNDRPRLSRKVETEGGNGRYEGLDTGFTWGEPIVVRPRNRGRRGVDPTVDETSKLDLGYELVERINDSKKEIKNYFQGKLSEVKNS